jgi:cytochrome c-type biogenesis protein CcmH
MSRTTILFLSMILAFLALAAMAQQDPQAVKVPDAEQFVGKPEGTPLAGDDLTRRTQEIAATLRCPVCQGLAIADSPSEMATNMKGQVRELLARGFTDRQIYRYFERSYGQFVLLKPKFQGVNTLVWVLPLLALALGVIIVFSKIRSLEKAPATPAPAEAATGTKAEVEAEDPYLARVRELVKGDK